MSEEEDLELLALQRQLDDAFQTTRPRPAFEDELWLRMQARRPIMTRLREGVAGLVGGIWEAPAVPSGAIAIALIVLVGAGIFTLGRLHPGGAGSATSGLSNQDGAGKNFGPNVSPEYGPLPVPAFGTAPGPPQALDRQAVFPGPVTLTWTGHLDVSAASLPVFRYQEPAQSDADRFAASLGARPSTEAVQGGLGLYAGKDFTLVVIGSVAQPAREPSFNLSELKSISSPSAADPLALATAYLSARHLMPTWPYQTEVQTTAGTVRVRFLRSFDVPSQGQVALVDGAGNRYGIEVDIATGGRGAFETGPLPMSLASAGYPIITSDQAVRSALASSAPPTGSPSYPAVRLTTAEIVYTLVWAGDHSFYEPAFLFSGTFTYQGTAYVKRVLVPAVEPSLLTH